ncbi:hypothetical protein [Azospirillum sp. sgz302134]
MTDEELARGVREAVAALNEALAAAARQGVAVELRTTAHQTTTGVEQLVAEVRLFKQI